MAVNTAQTVQQQKRKLRRRTVLYRAIACLIQFMLGLFAAGVRVRGRAMGAGTALVGASGPHLEGFCALVGTELGYLIYFGIPNGTHYMAASLMVYTVAFVCQYISLTGKIWFMPLIVMTAVGLTTAFGTVSTVQYEVSYLSQITLDILLCGMLTYLYALERSTRSKSMWCRQEEVFARLILAATVCCVLAETELFGELSLGRSLSIVLVLLLSYGNDVALGLSGAGLLGITMGSNAPLMYMSGVWAAKQIAGHRKTLYVLVYGLMGTLILALSGQLGDIDELLLGAGIFALTEGQFGYFTVSVRERACDSGERYFRLREAGRLQQMAEVIEQVPVQFRLPCQEGAETADTLWAMDRAMDTVCEACGKKLSCRSSKRVDMLALFSGARETVERRGRMLESDLPEAFRERCYSYKSLVLAVNYELLHQKESALRISRQGEASALAEQQYQSFGRVLRSMAGDMERFSGSAAQVELQLQRYLQRRRLQCAVRAFHSVSGRLVVQMTGADVAKLVARQGYLDELSQVLQMRLCVPESGKDCLTLYEAEPLAVTVGIASRKKPGEKVCGDQIKQFKTEQGMLYVLLCDGMGTGTYAHRQSCNVIANLEELLRCGIGAETAMEILNSLSYFRNQDEWGFATVDLAEVNLFTGEAVFYKYGAADSYVYDGKALQVISGSSLPIGMEIGQEGHPDCVRVQMKPGTIGLMVSDGVTVENTDDLQHIMEQRRFDMKTLSRQVLMADRDGSGDDMTVVAFSVEIRR